MKRPHLSFSALKAFEKSPNHFLAYEAAKDQTRTASPAMLFGSLVHCMVLEPLEVQHRYAEAPKCDRRTKAGKEQFAEFSDKVEDRGLEVITSQDWQRAENCAASIISNPTYGRIFDQATTEVEINSEISGFKFRAFVDLVLAEGAACGDLKTTRDASPRSFQRTMYTELYHVQAALYCALTGADNFYIVAAESMPPHNVVVYEIDDAALEAGREKLAEIVNAFDAWDGAPASYSQGLEILHLPPWAT